MGQQKKQFANNRMGWAVIIVSIGDCKAFKVSKNGDLVDLTAGNRFPRFKSINFFKFFILLDFRHNITDARDPGGRLGPQLANGEPDLRNLTVFFSECVEDDIIFVVSDGVHDNFGLELI